MDDALKPPADPDVPDAFYRAFEDRFRGSRALILGRLRAAYQPFIGSLAAQPGVRALDLGCGRGEWLEILGEAGIAARGVDLDDGMLEAARAIGLDVERRDALDALRAEANDALALVSGFHIAEHLSFAVLLAVMTEARRVLRPGGLLILETPNPENLVVGTANFHLDPTHVAPIPPDRMTFMAEFAGFRKSVILRLNGPEPGGPLLLNVFTDISVDYGLVAQVGGGAELDDLFARHVGTNLPAALQTFDRALAGRLEAIDAASDRDRHASESVGAALAARVGGVADDLAALAAASEEERRSHKTIGSTLSGHFETLAARVGEVADDLAALAAASEQDRRSHRTIGSTLSGHVETLAARVAALSGELVALASVSDDDRRDHRAVDATLLGHIGTLASRNERLSDDLASLMQWHDRPLWQKLLFRPSGRPVRALRRLAFHSSGKPRGGIFRRLARDRAGTPRAAFSRWMSGVSYLDLPWPEALRLKTVPPPEEPLGPDPADHPRRAELTGALGGRPVGDGTD